MRPQLLLCLAMFALAVDGVPAFAADAPGRPAVEWRQHLTVNDDAGIVYVITEIHMVSEAGNTNLLLLQETLRDQRYVMSKKFDIENHRSSIQISDVAGRKYIRASYPLPSAAKTRDELNGELEANPKLFDVADPLVTLETTAFSQTMRDSEISRRGLERRWLSDLRESIDPSFLEGIERMREQLFGTTLASMFYKLLGKYIFHGGCVPADADARVAVEAPDCNFDKSFGYPCSEKQLQRVEKAAGKKKALTKY